MPLWLSLTGRTVTAGRLTGRTAGLAAGGSGRGRLAATAFASVCLASRCPGTTLILNCAAVSGGSGTCSRPSMAASRRAKTVGGITSAASPAPYGRPAA